MCVQPTMILPKSLATSRTDQERFSAHCACARWIKLVVWLRAIEAAPHCLFGERLDRVVCTIWSDARFLGRHGNATVKDKISTLPRAIGSKLFQVLVNASFQMMNVLDSWYLLANKRRCLNKAGASLLALMEYTSWPNPHRHYSLFRSECRRYST